MVFGLLPAAAAAWLINRMYFQARHKRKFIPKTISI
jgi:hypothetical protein